MSTASTKPQVRATFALVSNGRKQTEQEHGGAKMHMTGEVEMSETGYYSTVEAAFALDRGLRELRRVCKEAEHYEWGAGGLPLHLETERDRAAANVRDAVRFLCSPEADE